jgi:putative effector of murein hydrolase
LTVIVGGFYFTLLTTAASVVGIRKLVSSPETEAGTSDNADAEEAAANNTNAPSTTTTIATTTAPISKPFSDALVSQLRILAVACGVGSVLTKALPTGPVLASLGFLMATLHNFCFGARLPKSFTKIVHPLVTCTSLTWTMALLLAKVTGTTFKAMLKSYRVGTLNPMRGAGAGDVLLFLLGPAVVSLAISMYDRRQLMKENLKEVVTGVGVSSVGGLFGTAAIVRLLQIASPALRLSLLSRNITSPLAMAIASLLGADVSLAVAMVVVTGLIGANFGASILSAFGVKDPVARGLGIGAAAHGLGTAAFVNEKDAFPFAAISMALTATACTCLVSVPVIKKAILQLALGV